MLLHRRSKVQQAAAVAAALPLLLLVITVLKLVDCRPMDDEPMFGATSEALESIFRALDQEEAESSSAVQPHHNDEPVAQNVPQSGWHGAGSADPWPLSELQKVESIGSLPTYIHPTLFTEIKPVKRSGDLEKASEDERALVLQHFGSRSSHWTDDPAELVPDRLRGKSKQRQKRHVEFVQRMRVRFAGEVTNTGTDGDYVINRFLIHFLYDPEESRKVMGLSFYVFAVPFAELLRPRGSRGMPSLSEKVKEIGQLSFVE
ncbi:uncharacterized protein PFL1_01469 [Pseudozyma flocculosa PF-1]|uniref:Uncharacterized protein n=1 Tax=Pseudozyma flocculosa TaxID=84751 RepID=A0A5C3FDI4_9BASI|nr:uncharacterized protein PFL1_01469 [Pseudozyma flocculosa PF-1]EPQ31284.1 hypothetical protein PFL1_01469 [Pseudozyma flocculosa PF-1]SPO41745.1 uncharacterized protein PSFLO_07227 [Pseudozyma flocculosa]